MPEPDFDTATSVIHTLRQSGVQLDHADGGLAAELADTGSVVLREQLDALLLVGIPQVSLGVQMHWIGVRVGWWPRESLDRRRVAVVSSRLSRDVGAHPDWFDLLRTLFCRLEPKAAAFVTVPETTAHRFVTRGSQLFGFECLDVLATQSDASQLAATEPAANQILLSRPILDQHAPIAKQVPLRDRLLTCLASQIWALRVSEGGVTFRALRARLTGGFESGSTRIAVTDGTANLPLVEAGAVPWILTPTPHAGTPLAPSETAPRASVPFGDYLLHWTRGPAGPWPDEPEADYLDRLILGVETSGRSALAALIRILETQRLIASDHLIRGQHRVVCFSDQQLEHLASRRVYRRHLHRWDFEPYGIAIRRDVLAALGARPVIYGDGSDFEQLQRHERPLFQRRTADRGTDWQTEEEWRLQGDLDFSRMGAADVFVFVRTETEAAFVNEISRFPVVVVPEATSG